MNASLTTTKLKKPHPSRLVGGAQTQNGLVLHLFLVDKNSGGISQEEGVLDPHQAPQLRVPVPGRQVHTTSGKNQWGLSLWKKPLEPQVVLKEPSQGFT